MFATYYCFFITVIFVNFTHFIHFTLVIDLPFMAIVINDSVYSVYLLLINVVSNASSTLMMTQYDFMSV